MILDDDLPVQIVNVINCLDRIDPRLRIQYETTEFYVEMLQRTALESLGASPCAFAGRPSPRRMRDPMGAYKNIRDHALLLFQADLADRVEEVYMVEENTLPAHLIYTAFEKIAPGDDPHALVGFFGEDGTEHDLRLMQKKIFTPSGRVNAALMRYGGQLTDAALSVSDRTSLAYRQAIRIPLPLGDETFMEL